MMQRSQSSQVASTVTSLMRSMSRGLPSLSRLSPKPLEAASVLQDATLPPGPPRVRTALETECALQSALFRL